MSSEAVGEPLEDLAARRLGGMVLAASDEFFGPKERLLEGGAGWVELLPDRCSLEACSDPAAEPGEDPKGDWRTVVTHPRLARLPRP